MPGIFGVHTPKSLKNIPIANLMVDLPVDNATRDYSSYKHFHFGRNSINAFHKCKFTHETENIIFGIDGTTFNFNINSSATIESKYFEQGVNFFNSINGYFSAYLFDKAQNKLHVCVDHIATHPIFYYWDSSKSIFIFSNEAIHVAKIARAMDISLNPSINGISSMLTFGFMLDNSTLVDEIIKMDYGSVITIDFNNSKLTTTQHFSFKSETKVSLPLTEIIDQIDDLLVHSVDQIWNLDKEYNYSHFALLSGGLDSRTNIFLAHELGYDSINTLTFSEENSHDQQIASKIAKDLHFNHSFISLANGDYLKQNIKKRIIDNDGLINYTGGAHLYYAVDAIYKKNYGMIHSGQIGDLVFGSYTKVTNNIINNVKKKSISFDPEIIGQNDAFDSIIKEYNTDGTFERFMFEVGMVNGPLGSERMISRISDTASPFYNKELLNFCLNIDDQYKFDQKIYIDWMQSKHPHIAQYKWAKNNLLPSNSSLNKLLSFSVKVYQKLAEKAGLNANHMNPFHRWHTDNQSIKITYDDLFDTEIDKVSDEHLRELFTFAYNRNGLQAKACTLTALVGYNSYLID